VIGAESGCDNSTDLRRAAREKAVTKQSEQIVAQGIVIDIAIMQY